MPGWQDFALSLAPHVHLGLGWGGSPDRADQGGGGVDATNQRLGIDVQKAAYEQYKQLPGSYADHTIEKLGQAVKLD